MTVRGVESSPIVVRLICLVRVCVYVATLLFGSAATRTAGIEPAPSRHEPGDSTAGVAHTTAQKAPTQRPTQRHATVCATKRQRNASDSLTMTGPLGVCACVSGWLHPSPAKYLQSRHVSSAAVFNRSYNHWLDRAGQWAGSVVISAPCNVRTNSCTPSLLSQKGPCLPFC